MWIDVAVKSYVQFSKLQNRRNLTNFHQLAFIPCSMKIPNVQHSTHFQWLMNGFGKSSVKTNRCDCFVYFKFVRQGFIWIDRKQINVMFKLPSWQGNCIQVSVCTVCMFRFILWAWNFRMQPVCRITCIVIRNSMKWTIFSFYFHISL